jgi:SAM-dependent methyltransferase
VLNNAPITRNANRPVQTVVERPIVYDDAFFDRHESTSLRSARVVISELARLLSFQSVVDVGCGRGAWLSVFREYGATTTVGYDGDYVDDSRLLITRDEFHVANFERDCAIAGSFDLAVCLEVVEHITRKASTRLIRSLCDVAPVVLFSAAIPGQGGTHHINEQWPEYWRDVFNKYGFLRVDPLRRVIYSARGVAPWYKQNLFVFVKEGELGSYPELQREYLSPCQDDVEIVMSSRLVPLRSVKGLTQELVQATWRSLKTAIGR